MIQSTISNSAHSDSEEMVDAVSDYEDLVDAVSDPKNRSKQQSKGRYLHYQRKLYTQIIGKQ